MMIMCIEVLKDRRNEVLRNTEETLKQDSHVGEDGRI